MVTGRRSARGRREPGGSITFSCSGTAGPGQTLPGREVPVRRSPGTANWPSPIGRRQLPLGVLPCRGPREATTCTVTSVRFGLSVPARTSQSPDPSFRRGRRFPPEPAPRARPSAAAAAVERLLGATDVLALLHRPAHASRRGSGLAERRGAQRLSPEQRAEHRGPHRHRGLQLLLGGLRRLRVRRPVRARRIRSSSAASFGANFCRSFSTAWSRCSRAAVWSRTRKSRSDSPGADTRPVLRLCSRSRVWLWPSQALRDFAHASYDFTLAAAGADRENARRPPASDPRSFARHRERPCAHSTRADPRRRWPPRPSGRGSR